MSAPWDKRRAAHVRFFPSEPMDAWSLLTVGRLDEARRAVNLGLASDGLMQFTLSKVKTLLDALQGDIRSAKEAIPSPAARAYYHHTEYFAIRNCPGSYSS